jgi:hypothetical protein
MKESSIHAQKKASIRRQVQTPAKINEESKFTKMKEGA